MTVGKLIKVLQTYPKTRVVSVDGYEGGVTDYIKLEEVLCDLECNSPSYYGEHEPYAEIDKRCAQGKRLVIGRGARPNVT